MPELELKATYGLVAPEEYKLPDANPQWSADVYKKFDLTVKQAEDPVSEENNTKTIIMIMKTIRTTMTATIVQCQGTKYTI